MEYIRNRVSNPKFPPDWREVCEVQVLGRYVIARTSKWKLNKDKPVRYASQLANALFNVCKISGLIIDEGKGELFTIQGKPFQLKRAQIYARRRPIFDRLKG